MSQRLFAVGDRVCVGYVGSDNPNWIVPIASTNKRRAYVKDDRDAYDIRTGLSCVKGSQARIWLATPEQESAFAERHECALLVRKVDVWRNEVGRAGIVTDTLRAVVALIEGSPP